MNVIEAMNKRKSIRAFRQDPVPKEILIKVMEAATRAPSWANHQPWEFAIVGGKVTEELKEALQTRVRQGATPNSDIPRPVFPERYLARGRSTMPLIYEGMRIARDDREARREFAVKGARFFDAPNCIIIYTDREIGPWSILDAGLVAQNINLAAVEYGLGTCMQAQLIMQADELRRILGIPEDKLIVIGLSIGYPDWDDPVNNFRSSREPLEDVVTWHGI